MMKIKFASLLLLLSVVFGILTASCDAGDDHDDGSNEKQEESKECDAVTFAPLGKPTEFTESSTPGVNLAVRRWVPEKTDDGDNIKSVIVFVHGGAGWHSGYADILGQSLKDNGIALVAYDQAGSGYSDGIDGFRQYFDSIDTVSSDFNKVFKDVQATYPGKKVFAMGESFGCMILLNQILREQSKKEDGNEDAVLADGYIFTGPVVKLLPEMLPPAPVIAILRFLAKFFPKLKMPGTDFFSTFDLAFGDKRWAMAGRKDPFIIEAAATPPRLGMVTSLLSRMTRINKSLEDVKVPFKIFTGEHEGRVDVKAIQSLADLAKSEDKSYEIVPNGYHQLFQDVPNVTQYVCGGVKDWVLARC